MGCILNFFVAPAQHVWSVVRHKFQNIHPRATNVCLFDRCNYYDILINLAVVCSRLAIFYALRFRMVSYSLTSSDSSACFRFPGCWNSLWRASHCQGGILTCPDFGSKIPLMTLFLTCSRSHFTLPSSSSR